jgi:hypothetical protein
MRPGLTAGALGPPIVSLNTNNNPSLHESIAREPVIHLADASILVSWQ